MLDLIHGLAPHEILAQWHHIIQSYTARRLTQYTDTFPALAGLARIVSAALPEQEYVAGMWSTDLRRGLAWRADTNTKRKPTRHESYIAPTWSWASLDGSASYTGVRGGREAEDPAHEPGLTATITSYTLNLATRDPYGPLSPGTELHLHVPVMATILGTRSWTRGSQFDLYHPTGQRIGCIAFDVADEAEGLRVLRCLALYRNQGECEHVRSGSGERSGCGVGLAIVPVHGREDVYRRVGRVWCLNLSEFEGLGEMDIVLV
jgi:hypothetical protein